MADPLRRTLSKLRGKRSKKGPTGGLEAECNGEGKEPREASDLGRKTGTPRESCEKVGGYSADSAGECRRNDRGCKAGGWCPHNHNNNNLSHSMCEADTSRHAQESSHSPINNDLGYCQNGISRGPWANPQSRSCNVVHNRQGSFSYGQVVQSPGSASYSQSPGFEEQWTSPHSAPAPSCAISFRYPQASEIRASPEINTGNGSPASADCYSGLWGGGRAFTTDVHMPSINYSGSVADSFGRSNQNHSEDSEEDDYYDNENLVCRVNETHCNHLYIGSNVVCPGTSQIHRTETSQVVDYGYQQRKARVDIYMETDRLRSQLQEAYYLLIHAMHDMPVENHLDKVVIKTERCPSSSQDSVYSQSSARAIESDVWSSDEASPKQLSHSDLISLNALTSSEINRLKIYSKSLDAICTLPVHVALQKSQSDTLIKYSPISSQASSDCEFNQNHQVAGDMDNEGDGSPQVVIQTVNWGSSGSRDEIKSSYSNKEPSDCSYMVTNCKDPTAVTSGNHGTSPKSPGLTVKKMQKWMYKGRLLSLEMKERITGSSQRAGGSCKPESSHAGSSSRPEILQTISRATVNVPGENQSLLQTDLIENVYASSVIRRELKVTEVNEQNLQKNHITVSKKRNWLTQSSFKYQHREENHRSKKFLGKNQTPNSCSSGVKEPQTLVSKVAKETHSRPQGTSTETALSSPTSPSSLSNCVSDVSEENDADDEGEIWYNPIPEDYDSYLCRDQPSSRAPTVPGSDARQSPVYSGGLPPSAINAGAMQTSSSSEISHENSSHSTDYSIQLQKQRFACKTQMGLAAEENISHKSNEAGPVVQSPNKTTSSATTEFSPPSSPNPLKKGGSINWSLPDKIKSPRTVRKLSMKMKKLPELSRKLSVKGTSNNVNSDNSASTSKGNCRDISRARSLTSSGNTTTAASRNVISRYHLDSSVSSQQSYKKKNSGSSKSSSKGGYLSDGDSPELIAKSGKHGSENRSTKGKEALPGNNTKTEIDIDAFRHYSFSDQPKCFQYISGLMSVHFYGAEDLKPPRIDSKDVFCAIQVDSVNKARTALLTCRTAFLDMDHTFNIELENAQHLKLVVFSWDPTPRKNRVCCHGTVVLPALFRVTKTHQLAVKLEPRGMIYVKLNLLEQWENSLDRLGIDREPVVFGVDAQKVVEKENVGLMVPLLMEKCIVEIENRGCQVVGLYRLCGSAAVKKELREAFERDSKAVNLCESQYPDINVITGVLKDYLRELPSPLITKQLYEAVLNAMAEKPLRMIGSGCENDSRDSGHTVGLLDCLPDVERATLKMLLDHLKLVASYHEVNKMTCQNLAVCFGPVLLSQRQETSNHNNRVFIDSEELASALDFKKHIEVLHYLLQLWPVKNTSSKESEINCLVTKQQQPCLRRKKQRPQMLNLSSTEMSGVLRPRVARLDSPSSNRYAGDWSSCGDSYFVTSKEEADDDDVPSEDADRRVYSVRTETHIVNQYLISKELNSFLTMEETDLSEGMGAHLHDLQESIDTLIGNLEKELNKSKVQL
ncbi:rho GTPase-activating protein SYDE2 [Bombina bombina]|uniref:rho GTPase-activating protein SYDE2 n=1 Tax=Bombina bombina TaxID=8345 RepID=UPI00235AB2CC|nr:rho GTPase-activating protein SYDE2 [Bombina bombina]